MQTKTFRLWYCGSTFAESGGSFVREISVPIPSTGSGIQFGNMGTINSQGEWTLNSAGVAYFAAVNRLNIPILFYDPNIPRNGYSELLYNGMLSHFPSKIYNIRNYYTPSYNSSITHRYFRIDYEGSTGCLKCDLSDKRDTSSYRVAVFGCDIYYHTSNNDERVLWYGTTAGGASGTLGQSSLSYSVIRLDPNSANGYWVDSLYMSAQSGNVISSGFTIQSSTDRHYNLFTPFGYFLFSAPSAPAVDPNTGIPESGVGGGGSVNYTPSDDTPIASTLPTLNSAATGFTRIYSPTLTQLQSLASYLWTDNSAIQTIWNHIKQYFEDPMEAFLGLSIVPCAIPTSGSESFKVLFADTGVVMNVASQQFVEVDCGSLTISEKCASALDYDPYTKLDLFLPYIGFVQLSPSEWMGKVLKVTYNIDIISGSCVAKLWIVKNTTTKVCMQMYSGHCSVSIPLTSANFSQYVSTCVRAVKALASTAAGVASAGLSTAAGVGASSLTASESMTKAALSSTALSSVTNSAASVAASKREIQRSGSFSGTSGFLSERRPFLIRTYPDLCNPVEFGQLNGYPSMIYELIGNLSGFVKVQQINLSGVGATLEEKTEILNYLKEGVIV